MAKLAHRPLVPLFPALLASLLTCMHCMHAAAVKPRTAAATRQSVTAAADAHALHVSPTRRLLHGRRRPQSWARCSACTIVSCTNSRCTGHCRANGRVHNCGARRPGSTASGDPTLRPFAEPPYIGCSHFNTGPFGCEFTAELIAPRAGYTLDGTSGTVSARCHPDPSAPGRRTYGACLCDYTSTDGNSQISAFCEASAEFAPEVPPFDAYADTVAAETGLAVEYFEEEVEYGGATLTVTLAAELEYLEYEVEGEVGNASDYVYL